VSVFVALWNHIPQEFLQELRDLGDIPQDPNHHPEGDALRHTLYVIEAAEEIAHRESLNDHDYRILINAAMTHDLGKVSTTEVHEDGRITAYGHPDAGVPLADAMLTRLGMSREDIDEILPLVREHMSWVGYFTPEITTRAIKRLAKRLAPATFEMWALLVEADMSGRPPKPKGLPEKAHQMLVMARELGINNGDLSSLQ
jgi:tRNA nucleotidyltransferase (CCA-adding enzyme)